MSQQARWVDGIGPPLRQIKEDLEASPTGYCWVKDGLALIAEIERLDVREEALRHAVRRMLRAEERLADSYELHAFWSRALDAYRAEVERLIA
ncbi:MAG: hypothetical protein M0R37_07825 [Bacteroidales bacterium]|nr:hypothetical protein [Bacteroidales bacterium]